MLLRATQWSVAVGILAACQPHTASLNLSPDSGLGSGLDSGHFEDAGQLDAGSPDSGWGDSGVEPSCVLPTSAGCFFEADQDIWVDGFGGTDDAGACCCGTPSMPCQTLTYAMAIIADGGTVGAQVHAYLSGGGEKWAESSEAWPVHLGLGVTLTAPGVTFSPPLAPGDPPSWGADAFDVYPYSATDSRGVTIQGDPQDVSRPIRIGMPPDAGDWAAAVCAIQDPPGFSGLLGLPLSVSNAWLAGQYAALVVGPSADLTVGPLPVHIAIDQQSESVRGEEGLDCTSASVQDTGGEHILQIHTTGVDLWAHWGCSVQLTHGPSFGLQPAYNQCPFPDGDGVIAVGNATVALGSINDPAEMHCFYDGAIGMGHDDGDFGLPFSNPSVTFIGNESHSGSTGLSGGSGYGAYISAGTLTATSSTFSHNVVGIWVKEMGSLILDSSIASFSNSPNQLLCNDGSFNVNDRCFPLPGFGECPAHINLLISNSATQVDINDVVWNQWDPDAGLPQTWSCDDSFYNCSCSAPGCEDAGEQSFNEWSNLRFQADIVYAGPAFDGGPFVFSSGWQGACP
jgi:hypothetical protein